MTRKKVNKKKVNKALLSAVEEGDVEALKSALAAGADVNAADSEGITSLMRAAESGNEEILKLLIEAGADVNAADCDDITPLICAAETGNEEILKLLIEAGADVNVEDVYGETALSVAAARGHVSCVEMLKAAGAEGDYDIQHEEVDDEEDCEEATTVWKGNIRQMWEYKMYWPGTLSELLNVGENDCLMYVYVCANEPSNEWSLQEDEYIIICLKREGGSWTNISWPKVPHDDADPYFPADWDWQEILDLVWEEKTVTYTTKLNEDYEQVEATWEVEE
ncbi:MAG: ankyrin repeat domain-containing protein [Akkermansia sp.]|nr:ankyrin repeat domain-containing protein [Akkermansia sp.]